MVGARAQSSRDRYTFADSPPSTDLCVRAVPLAFEHLRAELGVLPDGRRVSVPAAEKITPAQTLSIIRSIMQNILHFTLVFVVAARRLEVRKCSLRWADILWEERKIRIIKSRKKIGVDGATKTRSSERDVPMGRVLAHYLREWHQQTPCAKPTDFVFPWLRGEG